jgi:hypothetical protein
MGEIGLTDSLLSFYYTGYTFCAVTEVVNPHIQSAEGAAEVLSAKQAELA